MYNKDYNLKFSWLLKPGPLKISLDKLFLWENRFTTVALLRIFDCKKIAFAHLYNSWMFNTEKNKLSFLKNGNCFQHLHQKMV